MNPVVSTIRAPSVVTRAVLALVLLVGFYVVTLAIAAALFVAPVLVFFAMSRVSIRVLLFVVPACWVPAFLLLASLVNARVPRLPLDGRQLAPEEAPELFALVQELAMRASTRAPEIVVLSPDMGLSVREHDGRRVLRIGAALLARARVDELRAGLAHELGHFAFGDTRLLGLVVRAHAIFHSVVEATERKPFAEDSGSSAIEAGFAIARALGDGLSRTYAKIFFALTRPTDRRSELAADELSVKLVGREPAISLLEKTHLEGPMFDVYMRSEVRFAIQGGGLPTDMLHGFQRFADRMRERGITKEIEDAVRAEETNHYDTHPALAERLAAAQRIATAGVTFVDARPASSLVRIDLEAFFLDELATSPLMQLAPRGVALHRATWDELPAAVFVPSTMKDAREIAAKLFAAHPHASTMTKMLGAVVRSCSAGQLEALVHFLAPDLASVPVHERTAIAKGIGVDVIGRLLSAALLERGARMETSLGESSLVYVWRDERVLPTTLARDALESAAAIAELVRITSRLESAELTEAAEAVPSHLLPASPSTSPILSASA
jgi:Zn-dependent protease with chaperone function